MLLEQGEKIVRMEKNLGKICRILNQEEGSHKK